MIRAVLLLVGISMLVACSSHAPSADAPESPLPSPTRQRAPTRAVPPTQPSLPDPTALPPTLSLPTKPLALGEHVTIAGPKEERYTVTVHAMRRQAAEPALGITEPWLLVDWSVRNDGPRQVQWQFFRGRPSILAADGTPLNAEPIEEGVPLQVADIGSDAVACSAKATYTTLPFRSFMGVRGGWMMPPGGVYRTWIAFAQTPGLESDQLLFDVSFPQTPYLDSPMTHVHFDLASPPALAPLAWGGPPPAESGVRDMLTIADVHVEGITPGVPIGMSDERRPCQYSLALRMHVTNQSAQRVTFVARRLLLLDRSGRSLIPFNNAPDVNLGPRASAEVTVLFPAVREASEPALIYIDSNNYQTFALVTVQPK